MPTITSCCNGGDEFRLCSSCSAVYWEGTHHARMINFIPDCRVALSVEPAATPWLPSSDTLRTSHRVPSPHVRSERHARAPDSCICSVPWKSLTLMITNRTNPDFLDPRPQRPRVGDYSLLSATRRGAKPPPREWAANGTVPQRTPPTCESDVRSPLSLCPLLLQRPRLRGYARPRE